MEVVLGGFEGARGDVVSCVVVAAVLAAGRACLASGAIVVLGFFRLSAFDFGAGLLAAEAATRARKTARAELVVVLAGRALGQTL